MTKRARAGDDHRRHRVRLKLECAGCGKLLAVLSRRNCSEALPPELAALSIDERVWQRHYAPVDVVFRFGRPMPQQALDRHDTKWAWRCPHCPGRSPQVSEDRAMTWLDEVAAAAGSDARRVETRLV